MPSAPAATPPTAPPVSPAAAPTTISKPGNGAAAPPFPPFPPATPAPAPTPAPADIIDIGTDVKALDADTAKSKEAKEPIPAKDKDSKSAKKPPAATEGGRRSRAPIAILGLLVIAGGGAVGGMYAGFVPDYLGIRPGETPIADVTPTPEPTATAEATETAVAVASATPQETATPAPTETATAAATATPAATATVAATPTPAPTATAVAVVATPKPTPAPTKAPEDPEVAKKKAVALVKIGNDALNAGDGPKAVRNFGAAIAKDPNNAEAYLGLGTAYMLQGENAKAKSSFKKFLQLAPDHQYAAQTRQILGTL